MKSNKFSLGVGQAHSLEMMMNTDSWMDDNEVAMRWTPELFHKMSQEKDLRLIYEYLMGRASLQVLYKEINLDIDRMPGGHPVLESEQLPGRVRGMMKWDLVKTDPQVKLHLDEGQLCGKSLSGPDLLKKLSDVPVHGVKMMWFLLRNENFIPKEWKNGKKIYFWGTIIGKASSYHPSVVCMYWDPNNRDGAFHSKPDWVCEEKSIREIVLDANCPALIAA